MGNVQIIKQMLQKRYLALLRDIVRGYFIFYSIQDNWQKSFNGILSIAAILQLSIIHPISLSHKSRGWCRFFFVFSFNV